MYQPRSYRSRVQGQGLVSFNVVVKETDLYIRASSNLKNKAQELVLKYRRQLEDYIARHPSFARSLKPIAVAEDAPPIVKDMAAESRKVGVGPMAAVAGAIARFVGAELLAYSPEVIIENGGDIYLKSDSDRVIAIYAGKSPLSGRLGLEIRGEDTPLGVCTSSGTVGHSLSFGRADAVTVIAKSASLADAAATTIGNIINTPDDITEGIEFARNNPEILGVLIIKEDKIGVWGKVKLCQLPAGSIDTTPSPNL